ncbi:MAG: hypothetical protein ACKVOB_05045 [Sphingomonas sp.]
MTSIADIFGVIIGLNILFAGMVVTFIAGSSRGLAGRVPQGPGQGRRRRLLGYGLLAAGALYTIFSLYRLL